MKVSINSLIFILLAISACTSTHTSNQVVLTKKPFLNSSQEETWNLMIGKWYGSQPTKDGGVKQHIIERSPQGTYRVTFRLSNQEGKFEEQSETGHWGVSGPIYFSIFRGWLNDDKLAPADPTDPYNYDAYKIIKLTSEVFEYESYSSGSKFLVQKVAEDFKFPN